MEAECFVIYLIVFYRVAPVKASTGCQSVECVSRGIVKGFEVILIDRSSCYTGSFDEHFKWLGKKVSGIAEDKYLMSQSVER